MVIFTLDIGNMDIAKIKVIRRVKSFTIYPKKNTSNSNFL